MLLASCGGLSAGIDRGSTSVRQASLADLLTYRTVGSCSDGSLLFQYVSVPGAQLWTDPEGPITVAFVDLFLHDDGSYQARYQEWTDGIRTDSRLLTGRFSFGGIDRLDLSGLGTARLGIDGNRMNLFLTFTTNVNTAGLAGQSLPGFIVQRPSGLESREDYCSAVPSFREDSRAGSGSRSRP